MALTFDPHPPILISRYAIAAGSGVPYLIEIDKEWVTGGEDGLPREPEPKFGEKNRTRRERWEQPVMYPNPRRK